MSANLSKFAIYIVDDNFFNGNVMKKMITESSFPHYLVEIISPDDLAPFFERYLTDVNDLFLFSIELKGFDRGFQLAGSLRKRCKKCQIAFYGAYASKIEIKKLNLICPLGIIDTREMDVMMQLRNLLTEAIEIKRSLLGKKHLLKIASKRELMIVDAEAINYIATIKGERNRIACHQKKSIEFLETSLKGIKQLDLPEYYKVFKSYIINARQIKMIDRTNNVLGFFNGEELEVGKKIRKAIS
ncbi:LytTR family transcriptional regulator DNA-binding domain-containing protein [Enterococcus casseliflavus]|uniref:LytTR family transcriptional regulator DNA-binding domain-containing protein n=1 Tax=Enterococcus casseliflavus TaxID=37734 RepID=UPI0039A61C60